MDKTPNVQTVSSAGSDFKVVGYYPCWEPDRTDRVNYDVVTHVNYAFAIPTEDGSLLPLRNPDTARKLVAEAHARGVKTMLVVGGWDYEDIPLEATFVRGTDTDEKREKLAKAIVALCDAYDFDGVDLDWEYPRAGMPSQQQYEALILDLSRRLHAEGKLLTAAVIAGTTADGTVQPEAGAHSERVLEALDWINVMAYDGGDDEKHSPYRMAVSCGNYWRSRGIPAEKIVLGLPFYARPVYGAYREILEADPEAFKKDSIELDGKTGYYNGIPTIQKKVRFARENLGGVMIWELSQDTLDPEKSLLAAIGKAVG